MSREPIRIRNSFKQPPCDDCCYGVLGGVSTGYPPDTGKLLTRYAPFRRSPTGIATLAAPRLACVKPAASVHPEPGSNSSLYILFLYTDPDNLFFKRINALDSFFLGTCLYLSFNIIKQLSASIETGCKDNYFFFLYKLFEEKNPNNV